MVGCGCGKEVEVVSEGVLEGRCVLGAMLSLIAAPVDFTSLLPSALLPKQDAQFLSDWLCFALGIPRKPRHSLFSPITIGAGITTTLIALIASASQKDQAVATAGAPI